MSDHIFIRRLTDEDALSFLKLNSSVALDWGSFGLPLSSPFPRTHVLDTPDRLEATRKRWSITGGKPGWEIAWGAFERRESQSPQLIANISLSGARLTETQLHRAILGIAVDAKYQGQKLGTALMQTALNWAKSSAFLRWIDLGVFAHNASARKLYLNFGFIETGRTRDCFRIEGVRIDDIQMALDLNEYEPHPQELFRYEKLMALAPYQDSWAESFQRISSEVQSHFGELIYGIQHFGSTSIPGMAAKPVIDTIGLTASLEEVDKKAWTSLPSFFQAKGENGLAGRRYFVVELPGLPRAHF